MTSQAYRVSVLFVAFLVSGGTPIIRYKTPNGTLRLTEGLPVRERPNILQGRLVVFTIAPQLPVGLNLDTRTGEISGTAARASGAQEYTITGSNFDGDVAYTSLFISISSTAPTAAPTPRTVAPSPAPKLPKVCYSGPHAGHVLEGCVAGCREFATAASAIKACNALHDKCGGVTTEQLSASGLVYQLRSGVHLKVSEFGESSFLKVRCKDLQEVPPSALRYDSTSTVYLVGQALAYNTPHSDGGTVMRYSIYPPLPDGLHFDPNTGVISGAPIVPAAFQVHEVTASNLGGSSTAKVAIAVKPSHTATPTALPTPVPTPRPTLEPTPLPVDCVVSYFGPWQKCSVRCGGGVQLRYRTVDVQPQGSGAQCPPLKRVRQCNMHRCRRTSSPTATPTPATTHDRQQQSERQQPAQHTVPPPRGRKTYCHFSGPRHGFLSGCVRHCGSFVSFTEARSVCSMLRECKGITKESSGIAQYQLRASSTVKSSTTGETSYLKQICSHDADRPVTGLHLAKTDFILNVGEELVTEAPHTLGGTPRGFSVRPPLPSGLHLDTDDGSLHGTAQLPLAARTFYIEAFNTANKISVPITITIFGTNAPSPAPTPRKLRQCDDCLGLHGPCGQKRDGVLLCASFARETLCPQGYRRCFDQRPLQLILSRYHSTDKKRVDSLMKMKVGLAIAPLQLLSSGGRPVGYSVSPTLPPGLQLDPNSGRLSGTPAQPFAARVFHFIAFNTGGVAQTTVRLAVHETFAPTPQPTPHPTAPSLVRLGLDTVHAATLPVSFCTGCFGLSGPCISTSTLLGLTGARLCTDWSHHHTCAKGFKPCSTMVTQAPTPSAQERATEHDMEKLGQMATERAAEPTNAKPAHPKTLSTRATTSMLAMACDRCKFNRLPCVSHDKKLQCSALVPGTRKCPKNSHRCHRCPKIALLGEGVVHVATGLPYIDAGAMAHDTMTGDDVTKNIVVTGNTINQLNHGSTGLCTRLELSPKLPGASEMGQYVAVGTQSLLLHHRATAVYHHTDCHDKRASTCPKIFFDHETKAWLVQGKHGHTLMKAHGDVASPDMLMHGAWFVALDPTALKPMFDKAPMVRAECSEHTTLAAVRGKYVLTFQVRDSYGSDTCRGSHRTVYVDDLLK